MQEIKNNPQVYTTQEGIEEIKNNPQVYTTQEGIREIENNTQLMRGYIYIYFFFNKYLFDANIYMNIFRCALQVTLK